MESEETKNNRKIDIENLLSDTFSLFSDTQKEFVFKGCRLIKDILKDIFFKEPSEVATILYGDLKEYFMEDKDLFKMTSSLFSIYSLSILKCDYHKSKEYLKEFSCVFDGYCHINILEEENE